MSAYPSTPGSMQLQSLLQNLFVPGLPGSGSILITRFLATPNRENAWNDMDSIIKEFLSLYAPLIQGLRVLVALPDGTVAYDSAKGENNTFANYQNGTIGENHNTRVCIMIALLNNSGVGNESKFSSTTGNHESYTAMRMGFSPSNPMGTCRISSVTQFSS